MNVRKLNQLKMKIFGMQKIKKRKTQNELKMNLKFFIKYSIHSEYADGFSFWTNDAQCCC